MYKKLIVFIFIGLSLCISSNAFADHLSATMSIDSTAYVSNDRVLLTVGGTYSCGPIPQPQTGGSTFGMVQGSVRQASGRNINSAMLWFQPVCDGEIHLFESGVHAESMPWHGGKARVIANIFVQDCDVSWNCETVNSNVDTQISIRGGGNNK